MLRRSLGILVVLVLSAAVGCTTTAPSIGSLTGLPASIIIPNAVVLTASGSPGSSRGLFTWIFSTNCGGTFTSTTTPNNGPANPITIGPTDATTVQVTYDSTGATPGACTFTVKLVTSSGRSATLQATTTITARLLTVTKVGTGSGTVTSDPAGINCGATCAAGFSDGTVVTLTATPDAGSKFDGWSGDPDCSDGQVTMDADKSCTATFTLLTAGLSLTKGDSPDPVTYGQNVTYTLTVTNNGPDAATNVTLTDTLPTNVVLVSATPSQGSCSGTTTVTCNLGTINDGANATVTIVVQAKAAGIDLVVDDDTGACAYAGTMTDTASVSATEPDPVPGDNTATANTTIAANHTTIQAAVNAASAGQKIFVCPGTYNESLIITKALTITGAGIALVTINPTTTGYGIEVSGAGSNVTLEQFMLNAGNSRNFMIHVSHVSNFTIQNVKVVGAGKTVTPGGQPLGGVDLNTVTTATIKNIEVQDVSRNGISLTNSTSVTVESVNVHDTGVSTGWAGIAVYATTGTNSVTFAGTSTVTNTPMGLYVEDLAGTTVNLALSSGITFSGQTVAPIVRYGLGTVPGLEATGYAASFAEALGLIARLTAPAVLPGAAFFYTVSDALAAAVVDPTYAPFAVVLHLSTDEFFVGPGMKIQTAINAASAGDTIKVEPGTYGEQPVINKDNLTVRSTDGSARDGSADTIISPPESTSGGVLITSDGSTLQGFKIIDPTLPGAPHAHTHRLVKVEGDNNQVLNNWIVGRTCTNPDEGVLIRGETTTEDGVAEGNIVENNEVSNTCIGINSVSVANNRIARGTIIRGNYTHDNGWIGISIDRSPNSLVESNTLGPNNNSYALFCQARETTQGAWASVAGSVIRNNTVQGNPEGARFEACSGVTVGGSSVAFNTFTSNTIGIRLRDEAGNTGTPTVNYNNITGNGTGVSNDTTTGETLNAENNWWGCIAGPGNPGCDTVSGNVDFDPWLTAPVP